MNREVRINKMIKNREDGIKEVENDRLKTVKSYENYKEVIGYSEDIETSFGGIFKSYDRLVEHREGQIKRLRKKL